MQIDDILDDLPTTPHDRVELIEHLLGFIERMNAAIKRHQSYPDPDLFTIEQFTDQRSKYVGQLAVLFSQYGLVVQPAPDQTGRVILDPSAQQIADTERADFRAAAHDALNRAYGDDEPNYDDVPTMTERTPPTAPK